MRGLPVLCTCAKEAGSVRDSAMENRSRLAAFSDPVMQAKNEADTPKSLTKPVAGPKTDVTEQCAAALPTGDLGDAPANQQQDHH